MYRKNDISRREYMWNCILEIPVLGELIPVMTLVSIRNQAND